MAAGLAPVATPHGYVAEASLDGYVVDFNITIREEYLERLLVIKHVVDSSHHHLAILLHVLLILHSLQGLHDGLNDRTTIFKTECQSSLSSLIPLIGYPLYIEEVVHKLDDGSHPMVGNEGVHEVMTGMEPASRASYLHSILFLDALNYSLIKLGPVCRKILDVRVFEDLFLWDSMAATAFTVEQARLLKKYADEIVFSYDMDAAGQNATRRALEIAGAVGLKLRVALVGEGKDPDEFVNLHGGEAYLEAVAQAQPALDYLFGALQRQYDASTLDGQHHILDEMFAVLLAQQDTFQFNSFIRKMAMTLHMDEGMIRSEALSFAKKNHSTLYISQKTPLEAPTTDNGPQAKKQKLLEEGLLKYCLRYHMLPEGWELLKNYPFTSPFRQRLFDAMKSMEGEITEQAVEGKLLREDIPLLAELAMEGDPPGSVPQEEYIWPLMKMYLQKEYRLHTEKVQSLMTSDPEEARKEQMICIRLSKEIMALGRA